VLSFVACSYVIEPRRLAERISRVCRRYGLDPVGVVVSNNHNHSLPVDTQAWRFVRGSNECLDFSAYFEGSQCVQAAPSQGGSVIVLNDSLFTRHSAMATLGALVRVLPIVDMATMPVIAGKVDRYFSICFENPWSALQVYVSSYCFAVNRAGLECLSRLPALVIDDFQFQPFAFHPLQQTPYAMAKFFEFVSLQVTPQSPYAWHQSKASGGSAQLLVRKARCIYYEHRLSGEIGLAGAIVPINDKLSLRLSLFARDYFVRVYFGVGLLVLRPLRHLRCFFAAWLRR
jgi:hypothetical protein